MRIKNQFCVKAVAANPTNCKIHPTIIKGFLPSKSDKKPPNIAPTNPPRALAVKIDPAIPTEIPKSLIITGRVGDIIKDTIPIKK